MNSIKVLIVEDEKIAAVNLAGMIVQVEPEARILAILSSVKQAIEWFSANHADLIFMDIELGDGQSFEIFSHVKVQEPVIFTTAYDQFAIKAFKSNGIDYLLKPIDEAELKTAIEKYRHLVKTGNNYTMLKELFSTVSTGKEYKKRFMIQAGSRIRTIPVEDVAYFYFSEKATFLCTNDNHHFPVEFSLDKLEGVVDPNQFYRINRQMIVALNAIRKIYSLSKSRIKLELFPAFTGEVLLSFNKTPDFRDWLNK
jgi:DNA-binding LytR/AlgR family response regulator